MITILHGDNTVKSRESLQLTLETTRQQGTRVVRLEGKTLTLPVLESALGSQELFGEDKVVVVEELHSLPPSARKKSLIALLTSTDTNVILWEKRALTKTMLKPFETAKHTEFKSSSSLFSWLDSLGDTKKTSAKKIALLHDAFITDGDHFCYLMLIRQVRLLIQAKEGAVIAGPPFVQQKLRNQAAALSLKTLLSLHQKLLTIDEAHKTSRNAFSLGQELDLLTLTL